MLWRCFGIAVDICGIAVDICGMAVDICGMALDIWISFRRQGDGAPPRSPEGGGLRRGGVLRPVDF